MKEYTIITATGIVLGTFKLGPTAKAGDGLRINNTDWTILSKIDTTITVKERVAADVLHDSKLV